MKSKISSIYNVPIPYSENLRDILKNELKSTLGSVCSFEDDIWVISDENADKDIKVTYLRLPNQFRSIVKFYILRYIKNISSAPSTVNGLAGFFNFAVNRFGQGIKIETINYSIIQEYSSYLDSSSLSIRSKRSYWVIVKKFFERMSDFEEVPIIIFDNPNFGKVEDEARYIPPKESFQDLDRAFNDYSYIIPLHYQLGYWLMRLIPSRGNEIFNMDLKKCLRAWGDKYVITIPIYKTSKHLFLAKKKLIYMNNKHDIEKKVIFLMNEQKMIAQDIIKNNFIYLRSKKIRPNKLFIVHKYLANYKNDITFTKSKQVYKLDSKYFNKFIKKFVTFIDNIYLSPNHKKYSLMINDIGNYFQFTTHAFRHDGITSRINYGLSTPVVMSLSGLNSESTIWDTYYHDRKEDNTKVYNKYNIIDIVKDGNSLGFTNLDKANTNGTFIGKVSNERSLSKNIERYKYSKIVDFNGNYLGNCMDIYNCEKDIYSCIDCDYSSDESGHIDINSLFDMLKFWESEYEFYSVRNAKFQQQIAHKNIERIKARISRIERGKKDEP
jgi:hypothetical protein